MLGVQPTEASEPYATHDLFLIADSMPNNSCHRPHVSGLLSAEHEEDPSSVGTHCCSDIPEGWQYSLLAAAAASGSFVTNAVRRTVPPLPSGAKTSTRH